MSVDSDMPPDSVPLHDSTMTTSPLEPGSTAGASSSGNALDAAVDGNVMGGTLARL